MTKEFVDVVVKRKSSRATLNFVRFLVEKQRLVSTYLAETMTRRCVDCYTIVESIFSSLGKITELHHIDIISTVEQPNLVMAAIMAHRGYLVGVIFCLLTISFMIPSPSISRAYGAASIQINDEASCESQPVAGTWLANTNRCLITTDAEVQKDAVWAVAYPTTLVVSKEATLAVAGTLNSTGGAFLNEGTVNISKDAVISTIPINNTGILNNAGLISEQFAFPTLNNFGNLTNSGTISLASAMNNHPGGHIRNTGNVYTLFTLNGFFITGTGYIINLQDSTFDNYGRVAISGRTTLSNTGGFINHPGGLISIGGFVTNSGNGTFVNSNGATIDNDFSVVNRCPAIFTNNGTITGDPVIQEYCPTFPPPPPPKFALTVNAIDRAGKPVQGVWTTIRAINGTLLDSGFTPISFEGTSGVSYNISFSNYFTKTFMNWQDGGGTDRTRMIIIGTENRTITAVYDTGNSLRGLSPLTYTGLPEQPDLTVNATTIDGGKTLHMWTIIDPQDNEKITRYKVFAGNYEDTVFDHWEDGSKNSTRTLTIANATTITAYYRQGASLPPDNNPPMPPTKTISQDTHLDTLLVKAGETLLVEHNVTVSASNVTNYGTIINKGTLGFDYGSNSGSAAMGTIDNYGSLAFSGTYGNFTNIDGGKMNIYNDSRFVFDKGGSYSPHYIVNGPNSIIDNNGTVYNTGPLGLAIQNNGGLLYRDCTGVYSVPVYGTTAVDKCAIPIQTVGYHTTIRTEDQNGNPINGVWTIVRASIDEKVVKAGFSPLSFTALSNSTYALDASPITGMMPVHWKAENGGLIDTYIIRPTQDNSTYTGVYIPYS